MNDVTGMPQTALVIGGGSDLAVGVLAKLAARRLRSVVLAGPRRVSLEAAARTLQDAGVRSVEILEFDVRDVESHDRIADEVGELLDGIDLVVMAAGVLTAAAFDTLSAHEIAESLEVNLVGPAAMLTVMSRRMRAQGYGRIVVFSSAAGARVRAANLVYGAGKAGLDGFCQALGDSLQGTGVTVMIVRPGFVHTKMTRGRASVPLSLEVDAVANAVVRGIERQSPVVWTPAVLRLIFAVFRVLPQSLWRRVPG